MGLGRGLLSSSAIKAYRSVSLYLVFVNCRMSHGECECMKCKGGLSHTRHIRSSLAAGCVKTVRYSEVWMGMLPCFRVAFLLAFPSDRIRVRSCELAGKRIWCKISTVLHQIELLQPIYLPSNLTLQCHYSRAQI
jgi:hypothetical protein